MLQVVFCAGSHGWEDIENNRRIYAEAVGEAARLGKAEVCQCTQYRACQCTQYRGALQIFFVFFFFSLYAI